MILLTLVIVNYNLRKLNYEPQFNTVLDVYSIMQKDNKHNNLFVYLWQKAYSF